MNRMVGFLSGPFTTRSKLLTTPYFAVQSEETDQRVGNFPFSGPLFEGALAFFQSNTTWPPGGRLRRPRGFETCAIRQRDFVQATSLFSSPPLGHLKPTWSHMKSGPQICTLPHVATSVVCVQCVVFRLGFALKPTNKKALNKKRAKAPRVLEPLVKETCCLDRFAWTPVCNLLHRIQSNCVLSAKLFRVTLACRLGEPNASFCPKAWPMAQVLAIFGCVFFTGGSRELRYQSAFLSPSPHILVDSWGSGMSIIRPSIEGDAWELLWARRAVGRPRALLQGLAVLEVGHPEKWKACFPF